MLFYNMNDLIDILFENVTSSKNSNIQIAKLNFLNIID